MPRVQKSPRLMSYEQTRQALLRGRELIPIRDSAGNVTHYRALGTPACVNVETFTTLLAQGVLEEVAPGSRWAINFVASLTIHA